MPRPRPGLRGGPHAVPRGQRRRGPRPRGLRALRALRDRRVLRGRLGGGAADGAGGRGGPAVARARALRRDADHDGGGGRGPRLCVPGHGPAVRRGGGRTEGGGARRRGPAPRRRRGCQRPRPRAPPADRPQRRPRPRPKAKSERRLRRLWGQCPGRGRWRRCRRRGPRRLGARPPAGQRLPPRFPDPEPAPFNAAVRRARPPELRARPSPQCRGRPVSLQCPPGRCRSCTGPRPLAAGRAFAFRKARGGRAVLGRRGRC